MTNKIRCLFVFAVVFLIINSVYSGWQKSVTNKTIQSDKSVLFFTSRSCSPCQKMKSVVWPDKDVKEAVAEYDSSPQMFIDENNEEEFYKYEIKYVPTTIIINSKGREIKRFVGFMNVEKLLEFLG